MLSLSRTPVNDTCDRFSVGPYGDIISPAAIYAAVLYSILSVADCVCHSVVIHITVYGGFVRVQKCTDFKIL